MKTRLQPRVSAEAALRLHQAFVRDTAALAQRSGADRITIAFGGDPATELVPPAAHVAIQSGADLGERIANATREAFQQGSRALVLIGTDSPDVPERLLREAFDRLESVDVVLGPAADGGYYLIGLSEAHLGLFDHIEWGGEAVLAQTRARARELALRWHELEPWFDVDRPEDLERLAREITRRRRQGHTHPTHSAAVLEELGLLRREP